MLVIIMYLHCIEHETMICEGVHYSPDRSFVMPLWLWSSILRNHKLTEARTFTPWYIGCHYALNFLPFHLCSPSPLSPFFHSFPLYFSKDFSCPASNLHGLWSFARGRLWCGCHSSGWPDSLWYQLLPPWTTSRHWQQAVYSETERQHDRNARYHGGHWKTHLKAVISVT